MSSLEDTVYHLVIEADERPREFVTVSCQPSGTGCLIEVPSFAYANPFKNIKFEKVRAYVIEGLKKLNIPPASKIKVDNQLPLYHKLRHVFSPRTICEAITNVYTIHASQSLTSTYSVVLGCMQTQQNVTLFSISSDGYSIFPARNSECSNHYKFQDAMATAMQQLQIPPQAQLRLVSALPARHPIHRLFKSLAEISPVYKQSVYCIALTVDPDSFNDHFYLECDQTGNQILVVRKNSLSCIVQVCRTGKTYSFSSAASATTKALELLEIPINSNCDVANALPSDHWARDGLPSHFIAHRTENVFLMRNDYKVFKNIKVVPPSSGDATASPPTAKVTDDDASLTPSTRLVERRGIATVAAEIREMQKRLNSSDRLVFKSDDDDDSDALSSASSDGDDSEHHDSDSNSDKDAFDTDDSCTDDAQPKFFDLVERTNRWHARNYYRALRDQEYSKHSFDSSTGLDALTADVLTDEARHVVVKRRFPPRKLPPPPKPPIAVAPPPPVTTNQSKPPKLPTVVAPPSPVTTVQSKPPKPSIAVAPPPPVTTVQSKPPAPSPLGDCAVCWGSPSVLALVPCGHVCLCSVCITLLTHNQCPICRTTIKDTLRVYPATI